MKRKLLFINGHLNAGGCERSLTDLLKHLDYEKYEVDLLLLEDLGDYLSELPPEVNVLFYPLGKAFGPLFSTIFTAIRTKDWFSLRYRIIYWLSDRFGKEKIKYTKKLFDKVKTRYDTIIAYRPGVCSDLAAYVFTSDQKISWWHHGEVDLSVSQIEELNSTYYYFDIIVAVSESSARIVEDTFANAKHKTIIIPNMVCRDELLEKAKKYNPFENESTRYRIVSVGRMSPEKNMRICPQIAKLLLDDHIDFIWFLIGDGEERDSICNDIKKLKLSDRLVAIGRLDNPYPYIADADVLVHPSSVESQGLTVLEAMVLGTPVVVVESQGPKEYIEDGINGSIVSNSANEISRRIENAICYCDDSIIQNAINTAEEYAPDRIIKRIDVILN